MKTKILTSVAMVAAMGLGSMASAEDLRLSHQWSNKDIRHQVAEIVAK